MEVDAGAGPEVRAHDVCLEGHLVLHMGDGDSDPEVENLLTGEVLELEADCPPAAPAPPGYSKGKYQLRFEGGSPFVYDVDSGQSEDISGSFQWKVFEDSNGRLLKTRRKGSGVEHEELPLLEPSTTLYPTFELKGKTTAIAVHIVEAYAPGSRFWWQGLGLATLMVGATRGKPSAWVLDLWACWCNGFKRLFPAAGGFVKNVPRGDRRARRWDRWALEHVVSTLGVVWMFTSRAATARPATSRKDILAHFGTFLMRFFDGEQLSVDIVLDDERHTHMGTTTMVGQNVISFGIDSGMLKFDSLCNGGGPLARSILRLLRMCRSYDQADISVSLTDALMIAVNKGPAWFATQLLLQVAMAVEMFAAEKGFTENPCDVMANLPDTWRWNEDLKDALTLGKGPNGSGDPAVLPAQHVRSVLSFVGKRTVTGKPKQLCMRSAELSLLTRYIFNCKNHFSDCPSISLAADATRLGGRDILLVMAVGHKQGGQETLAAWAPPQVMPDYNKFTFEVDESSMTGEEWVEVLEHKRWFQAALRGWFEKVAAPKRKKLERRAAYWFLMALNSALVHLSGVGLEAFVSNRTAETMESHGIKMLPGVDLDVGRGGVLGLSVDQHSVGWCAINFMKYGLGLRVEATPDVFHRCWNDVKLAMGRSGWWEAVLLSSIYINVNFGPWGGAKFWRETQGAAEEYFKHVASNKCGLFMSLLPLIASDRRESDRLVDNAYASQVFEMLKGGLGWATKGPKMALCRWFGWLHCIDYWLPMVTLRLVVLLYWGLSMGYVSGAAQSVTLRLEGLSRQEGASGSSQQATMAQAQASAKQLFDRAKNTLHIATILLMDRSLTKMLRVAQVMCGPFERWYHDARVRMRSAGAALDFHKEQSLGACLLPLLQTFGRMQDKGALNSMGFTTSLAELPLASLAGDASDESAVEEDAWARKVFKFAFELVRARLRSVLSYMEYYPLAFAAFLSDSEQDHDIALRRMREVWAAWQAAQECDLPHVTAMTKRSFMLGQVAASAFELLAGDERDAREVFKDIATAMLSVGHTAVIEDAFQRLRLRETRAASHNGISPRAAWATVLQRQLLTDLYKFKSCGTTVAPAMHVECMQKPVSNNVHLPGKCAAKAPLKRIIGTSSSVPWVSMSPQSSHVQLADVAAWRQCLAEGQASWSKLGRGWSNRLALPGMLIRRKQSGRAQSQWWWSLGAVESEAILLWKNCEVRIGGQMCHFPAHAAELVRECYRWDVIYDHTQWECLPLRFQSPRRVLDEAAPNMRVGAVAVSIGEPTPLLQMCAREGFTDFPVSLLRTMCVDLGITIGQNMNLCEVLRAAIRGCVPGIDDSDVVEILHRRLRPEQLVDSEFWAKDEVMQCFDKGDEEIVKKYKTDMLEAGAASESHKSMWEFTKRVIETKAKAKAKGRAKSQSTRTLTAAERKFNPKPADLLSEDGAQSYLPDGAKVWKDGRENRWVVRYKPYGSISRSWTVYGEIGAFGRCAAWAWTQHSEAGLQECPFPWVLEYNWQSGA